MSKTINSNFAILDVLKDRADVAKRIAAGERISVVITGTLTHQWGADDGISIEFQVEVSKVEEIIDHEARIDAAFGDLEAAAV